MLSGLEIWCFENLKLVSVPKSSHRKFYSGSAYVILNVSTKIVLILLLFSFLLLTILKFISVQFNHLRMLVDLQYLELICVFN